VFEGLFQKEKKMLSKRIATILFALVVMVILSACKGQPHNSSVGFARLLTPLDWLILGGALVLLFLVPVVIMYWPRRTLS